jgi:hypothetical protein
MSADAQKLPQMADYVETEPGGQTAAPSVHSAVSTAVDGLRTAARITEPEAELTAARSGGPPGR